MAKKIQLTQGKVTIVDDEDFEWLNQWKWYYFKNKTGKGYAIRNSSKKGKRQSRPIYMHKVILGVADEKMGDHRNGDTLDNQRINLRPATNQQNCFNSKKQKGCSSKYKGVYWNKPTQNWRSRIHFKEKTYHLGYFKKENEAAKAYNQKAIELFGEFAWLNHIEERAS